MNIKLFKASRGAKAVAAHRCGKEAVEYLLADHDHWGEARDEVKVSCGNPALSGEPIDSQTFKHWYRSGAIAWAPGDALTGAEIDAELEGLLAKCVRREFSCLATGSSLVTVAVQRAADGSAHLHILLPDAER